MPLNEIINNASTKRKDSPKEKETLTPLDEVSPTKNETLALSDEDSPKEKNLVMPDGQTVPAEQVQGLFPVAMDEIELTFVDQMKPQPGDSRAKAHLEPEPKRLRLDQKENIPPHEGKILKPKFSF